MTNNTPLEPETIPDNGFPSQVVATDVQGTTLDTVNKNQKDAFTLGNQRVVTDAINGRIIIYDEAGVARVIIGFLQNGF